MLRPTLSGIIFVLRILRRNQSFHEKKNLSIHCFKKQPSKQIVNLLKWADKQVIYYFTQSENSLVSLSVIQLSNFDQNDQNVLMSDGINVLA